MVVPLLEGIDLIAVAALFVVVGLLYTVKWWLRPCFATLEATIGKIPTVGRFVTKAENAVIDALDTAIKAVEGAALSLFKGGMYVAHLTGNAILTLATQTEQALGNLWHTRLPMLMHVSLDPIRAEINATIGSLGEINTRLTDAFSRVDGVVRDLRHEVMTKIEPTVHDLTAAVIPRLQSEIQDVQHVLHNEIGELARATGRTVTDLEHELTAGLKATTAEIVAARTAVEGELTAGLTAAEVFARSQAGTVERELKDFENLVPLAQIGTIIAAWPFVYSLTQSLVAEAGLGNSECRRKVGDVCGVSGTSWTNMLGLLGAVGVGFGLSDLLGLVETTFTTVVDDAIAIAES